MIDFKSPANAIADELVALRRDFHKHPEIGFEEIRTAGIVVERLQELGLEVRSGVGKTGVIGLLEGAKDGPTVLYRADMDALPIQEKNAVGYRSVIRGKMHACGHDAHVAVALGLAKLFSQHRDQMAGRIKFVFQPAEEIVAGAKAMIAEGALENPRPDVCLGMHVWNNLPFGTVAVTDGPSMAGSSTFDLLITGKGGHAASPHFAADPVVCAAQLITALQTIPSRNIDPLESAVLSVTEMKGSDAYNIIPEQVELAGTVRAFKIPVRDLIEDRMKKFSASLCSALGCKAKFVIKHNTTPVANHPDVAPRVRAAFSRMMDPAKIVTNERTMGSEDVGLFMSDIPGVFAFIGSANAEQGLNYSHHHQRFDIDERVLPFSVALMATAIADYIMPR